jgi:hypothetical protein
MLGLDSSARLVPYMDLVNHDLEANSEFRVDKKSNSIILSSLIDIDPGVEVTIQYFGSFVKGKMEMFVKYNFIG